MNACKVQTDYICGLCMPFCMPSPFCFPTSSTSKSFVRNIITDLCIPVRAPFWSVHQWKAICTLKTACVSERIRDANHQKIWKMLINFFYLIVITLVYSLCFCIFTCYRSIVMKHGNLLKSLLNRIMVEPPLHTNIIVNLAIIITTYAFTWIARRTWS